MPGFHRSRIGDDAVQCVVADGRTGIGQQMRNRGNVECRDNGVSQRTIDATAFGDGFQSALHLRGRDNFDKVFVG